MNSPREGPLTHSPGEFCPVLAGDTLMAKAASAGSTSPGGDRYSSREAPTTPGGAEHGEFFFK